MTSRELFIKRLYSPDKIDVRDIMPFLYLYRSQCKHITEFGTRSGNSTSVFLACNPDKLRCYDLRFLLDPVFYEIAKKEHVDFTTTVQDLSDPKFEIEETDFLFIDDLHSYEHVKFEIKQHESKVKKYLAFHDTYSYGTYPTMISKTNFMVSGRHYSTLSGVGGIIYAINEFESENPQWKKIVDVDGTDGLIIFERVGK